MMKTKRDFALSLFFDLMMTKKKRLEQDKHVQGNDEDKGVFYRLYLYSKDKEQNFQCR